MADIVARLYEGAHNIEVAWAADLMAEAGDYIRKLRGGPENEDTISNQARGENES